MSRLAYDRSALPRFIQQTATAYRTGTTRAAVARPFSGLTFGQSNSSTPNDGGSDSFGFRGDAASNPVVRDALVPIVIEQTASRRYFRVLQRSSYAD